MRRGVVVLGLFLILAAVNYSIVQREQLLANGRVVLLELAPVDPRSLMQGDYMALRFAVQTAAAPRKEDGFIVLGVDERGVGAFRRIDDGTALAGDEMRLFYRVRFNEIKLGTNAFFFQEGDAGLYEGAKFGEIRLDGDGRMLLTGLRDAGLRRLGR